MSSSVSESPSPTATVDPVACFTVSAAAEPGVMPRVLELFAKRGLVPTDWQSRVTGDRLTIDIRVRGMERRLADYVGACLRQTYLVERVLVTHDRGADHA